MVGEIPMATNEETPLDVQSGTGDQAEKPLTESGAGVEDVASFAGADLAGADLSGADLSGTGAFAGMPIPPADFTFLIYSLSTQAQLQLGLLRLDENSNPEANLPMARHTIDLLAMLQQKTQGNLSLSEKLLIENTLTDLRYRFVQVSQQASQ